MSDAVLEATETPSHPNCKKKHICKVCRKEIAHPGKFCFECKSYQDWRLSISGAQIPLALLTALISVVTSAITALSWSCYHQSHTSAMVISGTTAGISLYVWNTGRNPSVVTTCTLRYTGASNEDIPIELDPKTALIPAEGQSIIPLNEIPKPHEAAVQAATLLLKVQESDGDQRDLPPLKLSDAFLTQVRNRS